MSLNREDQGSSLRDTQPGKSESSSHRQAEQRGEAFAEALYGIIAVHGPAELASRERLELGHFLCLATTDWVRARNRAKATAPASPERSGDDMNNLAGEER